MEVRPVKPRVVLLGVLSLLGPVGCGGSGDNEVIVSEGAYEPDQREQQLYDRMYSEEAEAEGRDGN